MEVSAHRVTNVRVKETIHDGFAVKQITFLDGDNNMITIRLFGSSRTELNFIHEDTIDARENALC
jgi:hypothetical protein